MRPLVLAISLLVAAASTAIGHDPRPGPNGGLKVDAGARHHAELVANGTTQVVVFLYDQDDRPVPAAGYRANAILVVDGRTQRFPLQAGEANRLVGAAPVPVPAGVRGAVQITGPDGSTAQARF
jgi:pSer/pThr/pTyr-binding forkhead associated (FHA) protein